MKRSIKRLASKIWAVGSPVRRPFVRKFRVFLKRSVDQAIAESLHPPIRELLVGVGTARSEVGTYRNETNLLLDSLVREVTRLQDELEAFRSELHESRPESTTRTILKTCESRAESA